MTLTIEAVEGMPVRRGTDAAPENGRDPRLVVGTGVGIETSVRDGKAPQLEADEKAPPTRQRHEARLTMVVSVARPRQASLLPKMLKYVPSAAPPPFHLKTLMYTTC